MLEKQLKSKKTKMKILTIELKSEKQLYFGIKNGRPIHKAIVW